jgi:hypothetical protein
MGRRIVPRAIAKHPMLEIEEIERDQAGRIVPTRRKPFQIGAPRLGRGLRIATAVNELGRRRLAGLRDRSDGRTRQFSSPDGSILIFSPR